MHPSASQYCPRQFDERRLRDESGEAMFRCCFDGDVNRLLFRAKDTCVELIDFHPTNILPLYCFSSVNTL